jgi:hypothetical protein
MVPPIFQPTCHHSAQDLPAAGFYSGATHLFYCHDHLDLMTYLFSFESSPKLDNFTELCCYKFTDTE